MTWKARPGNAERGLKCLCTVKAAFFCLSREFKISTCSLFAACFPLYNPQLWMESTRFSRKGQVCTKVCTVCRANTADLLSHCIKKLRKYMQIILFHKHVILSRLISLKDRDVTQLVTEICPIFLHIFKAAKKQKLSTVLLSGCMPTQYAYASKTRKAWKMRILGTLLNFPNCYRIYL